MVTYRKLQKKEAQKFWNMLHALDNETSYMMYEPGERAEKAKDLRPIEALIESSLGGNDFLLVAEVDGEIIGYISAERGTPNRIGHTAYIVLGIRGGYRGNGIGKEFLKRLDTWALNSKITRLELTVMQSNIAAKSLYEKSGFVVEGVKKKSMFVDGKYEDECYMAKLF